MSAWTLEAGGWLLQAAAALPDTIVTKQVAAERGWFETVTSVASGIMTLTLIALAIALIPAAWNFRKSYRRVNKLLDQVYGDVSPLMRHASTIADNVNYITTSVRVDVQEVNRTIAEANQRLREAAALTERRLQEFNALLLVVQQEAEHAFVESAATVRGVRAGAAMLREDLESDLRGYAEGAEEEELDEDEGESDPDGEVGVDIVIEAHEVSHGNDSTTTPASERARPRIRPRGRSGRA